MILGETAVNHETPRARSQRRAATPLAPYGRIPCGKQNDVFRPEDSRRNQGEPIVTTTNTYRLAFYLHPKFQKDLARIGIVSPGRRPETAREAAEHGRAPILIIDLGVVTLPHHVIADEVLISPKELYDYDPFDEIDQLDAYAPPDPTEPGEYALALYANPNEPMLPGRVALVTPGRRPEDVRGSEEGGRRLIVTFPLGVTALPHRIVADEALLAPSEITVDQARIDALTAETPFCDDPDLARRQREEDRQVMADLHRSASRLEDLLYGDTLADRASEAASDMIARHEPKDDDAPD